MLHRNGGAESRGRPPHIYKRRGRVRLAVKVMARRRLRLGRFGTRLHTESVGSFGTLPTPNPVKRPTFNTVILAPQLPLTCAVNGDSRAVTPQCGVWARIGEEPVVVVAMRVLDGSLRA